MALVAAVCFNSSLAVLAHGPFDSSTHVVLSEERLEVSVILGPDAAHQFFASYLPGFPLPQPVGRGSELPVQAATNLFSLSTLAATLVPKELRVLTDGLEFTFITGFARPDSGPLRFHASFFQLNERIAPGVFDVRTEDGKLLSTEVLSHSTATASIALTSRSNQLAAEVTDLPHAVSVSHAPIVLTNLPVAEPKATRSNLVLWAMLALGIVMVAGWSFSRGR